MGNRVILAVLSLTLLSACAAFDDSSILIEDVTPTGEPNIIAAPGGAIYQGYYEGSKTLKTNTCSSVSDATGSEVDFAIDVLQSGGVLSVEFADGSVENGTLNGNKVDIMIKGASMQRILMIKFNEDGASGSIMVFESVTEGQLGDSCAEYEYSLEKGTKPDDWGSEKAAAQKIACGRPNPKQPPVEAT